MHFILQALYYFLPAYVSNMVPVVLKHIPLLAQPIDGSRTWKGKPLFGPNKTWRGLILGTLAGTLTFTLQQVLYNNPFFNALSLFDYSTKPLMLGFLLASGALLGDLVKSFIKRRLDKAPGSMWFPWDQLDLVIGGLLFSFIVYIPSARVILTLLILTPLLHYATNRIAYWIRLKRVSW